jgi:hypothetical protein
MRYDEYLAAGSPIASGPVGGACKNLIQDWMERSGMHWTEAMAEAIVKLRLYLSGISTSTGRSTFSKNKIDFIRLSNERRRKVVTRNYFLP